MISYTHCPVCKSADIHGLFSAKDHTVSGKAFVIMKCTGCTLLFTQDPPSQQNIGKYYCSENYISHSDTQKGLINKLYHFVRSRTLRGKRKLVQQQARKRQGRILDVGCGTGAFLGTMQRTGWNCTGLEPDENARTKAMELYNVSAIPSDRIYQLPHGHFDVITMWHVLEHVHELQEYVVQLHNMLAPGGKLFIAVPNHLSYDARHYGPDWAAYDVPRHLYHFSPLSMEMLLHRHEFTIQSIKPMWFDSFYVSMLSEKYRFGKGNILKAFSIGLLSNIQALKKRNQCSSLIYIIEKS